MVISGKDQSILEFYENLPDGCESKTRITFREDLTATTINYFETAGVCAADEPVNATYFYDENKKTFQYKAEHKEEKIADVISLSATEFSIIAEKRTLMKTGLKTRVFQLLESKKNISSNLKTDFSKIISGF